LADSSDFGYFSKDMNVVFVLTCILFSSAGATTTGSPATAAASATAGTAKCDAADNKGFAKSKCGTAPNEKCCHPSQEVCVVGTPHGTGAKEQSVCSKNRALYGTKVAKVVIIPVCAEILLIFLLVHMGGILKKMKTGPVCSLLRNMKPRPVIAVLCFLQAWLAMFVVLSEVWKFGVYSALLSVAVFHTALNERATPKWAFGIVVLLQLGNILAILGAAGGTTNGVFLPLGAVAADGGTASWAKGMIDSLSAGEACSNFYGKYYHMESVEINADGADPEVKYYGLCSEEWITTVIAIVSVKMLIQCIMTALSAKLFAEKLANVVVSEDEQMQKISPS